MTEAQWRDFVMTGTRTGKLAVTRPDGRPHVTPIWFAGRGAEFGARNGVPGELLVRLRITKVVARSAIAS